jgi:uncharacterized protein
MRVPSNGSIPETAQDHDAKGFSESPPYLQETSEGLVLTLLIQPRASQDGFAGIQGQAVKLRLTAPPVDGAANKRCIAFLSKQIHIPKSSITIIAGETGRLKRVLIRCKDGPERSEIKKSLTTLLRENSP